MSMTIRRRFDKTCRALPLLQELLAAGVAATQVLPWPGYTEIDLDPADFAAAAAVVAAHDAAALDAADAALAAQDAGDLGKVRTAYQAIRNQSDQLRADAASMPPAPLTAAQVRARLIAIEVALADLGDATAALARYVGRRLG